jgi:hypothetical protein
MQVAARAAVKAVRSGGFSRAPLMAWMARTGAARLPLPRPWLQSFQKVAKDRARRPLGFGEFLRIADEN